MRIISFDIRNSRIAALIATLLLLSGTATKAEVGFWRDSERKAISLERENRSGAIDMYRLAIKDATSENAPVEKRLGLFLNLADLLYYDGRSKEAVEFYETGAALAKENDLKNWQARFLVNQSRNMHELCRNGLSNTNDPAIPLKALELRPDAPNTTTEFHIECLRAIGEAYLDRKDYTNAERFLKQAVVASDRLPDAQYLIDGVTRSYLQLRIAQHRYADAIRLLAASTASHPGQFYFNKEYFSDAINEVDPAAGTIKQTVTKLLAKNDFSGLDAYANELRKSQAQTVGGNWAIRTFLGSIDLNCWDSEEDWKNRIALVNNWISKYPNSVTAKVALADLFTTYAWKARGGGWASEVTDTGWYLMGKRLDDAWRLLYRATPRTPDWYSVAQTVALGKSWTREQYDAMIAQCQRDYPNYNTVKFNKAYWLQPKWFGEPGEAIRYINEECAKPTGIDRDVLYAQFAWNLDFSFSNVIKDAGLDWLRVKRGMLELVKRNPKSLAARAELAYLALNAGDNATALAAFPGEAVSDQPIKMRPQGYAIALEQGEEFQKAEKRPEAIAAYTKAISLDPKSGEAYSRRAELYLLQNRHEESLADINTCISMFPAWASALAERSRLEHSMEMYPESIKDVEKALAVDPTQGTALTALGQCYDAMGNHQRALDVANYGLESDEQTSPDAVYYDYMDRGLVWSNAHQFDQSQEDLKRGINLRPGWSQLWAYLGYIYCATDQTSNGDKTAAILMQKEKFAPRGNRLLGEMYRGGGQWTKALAAYEKSTSMEPTYGPGFWQRAITEIALGNYDAADKSLHHSVELVPHSAMAQSYLALVLDLQGKTDAAQSAIAKAFAETSEFPMNYVNRALIELHHGDLTKAAADCQKALDLDAYSSDAYATAAAVLKLAGKDQAAQQFEQTAKTMWWHPWPTPLPAPDKVAAADITITAPTLKELKPQPFELATRDLAP